MSTDQATADPAQAAEPEEALADAVSENLGEYGDILVGRAAVALDRMQRNSAMAYAMSEFAATNDQELLKERLASVNEGGDMAVSVGNKVTNNYYSSTNQSASASAQPLREAGAAAGTGAQKPGQSGAQQTSGSSGDGQSASPETPCPPILKHDLPTLPSLPEIPKWVKVALAAVALGGSGAVGYGVNALLSGAAPAAVQQFEDKFGTGELVPLPLDGQTK